LSSSVVDVEGQDLMLNGAEGGESWWPVDGEVLEHLFAQLSHIELTSRGNF